MKKFAMTDEKRHDLRELKITVIILLAAAFVLGMFDLSCYFADEVYKKELPLGTYLVYYRSRNLAEYKKTIAEYSVPTLNDIKKVHNEKEITDRYNSYMDSCLRVYAFEYGAELGTGCEVFFTKYMSDTGVGGYYGAIGRPSGYLFEEHDGLSIERSYSVCVAIMPNDDINSVCAQVIMPNVDITADELNSALAEEYGVDFDSVTKNARGVIGVGLPRATGKSGIEYMCIVLKDGIIELGFDESMTLVSRKLLCGDYSKSNVSESIGALVDLRNEAFSGK